MIVMKILETNSLFADQKIIWKTQWLIISQAWFIKAMAIMHNLNKTRNSKKNITLQVNPAKTKNY